MRTDKQKAHIEKLKKVNFEKGLPRVKLTKEQAYEVRYLAQNRLLPQKEIMQHYGISYYLLYRIMNNLAYTEDNPTWLKALPYYGQEQRAA